MKLCETEKCTGCGACFNSCPKQCISMRESDNGYKYPVINQEICINCGLCSNNCPILTSYKKNYPITLFSAIYKSDDAALLNSSSGGIAYALSEYLLNSGGIVFGAAYDDNMNVKHIEIQDKKDLYKLQGSKYVQSDTGNTFSKVKDYLSDGKRILFFGLPCQISGLYSYLGSFNTENLYTCDLLCGGAPSPGVFKKYINYLEQKYKSKAENLNFRSKKYNYGYLLHQLTLHNGKEYLLYGNDAAYLKSMGAGYVRNSCLDCEYASVERIGDLTIGDSWHLNSDPNIWKKGVSLVLINTLKGEKLFSGIKDNLIIQERTTDDLKQSQHLSITKRTNKPLDYDDYFKDYKILDWKSFSEKYLKSKTVKQRILDNIPPAIVLKISNILRK